MHGGRLIVLVVSAVTAVGAALTLGAGDAAAPGRMRVGPSAVVTIDLQARRQTIQGFGSSVRVWSDPHLSFSHKTVVPPDAQARILTAIYRRLGLTRSRQVINPGISPGPQGPYDFSGILGDDQIAYVKQAQQYGLQAFFPGPLYLEDWMKSDDPGGYVAYAMAMLRYWRSQGLEPPLYAPINEPQVSHDFPPSWMHDVVVLLGRRLRAEGFRTKLVVPDDENPVDAYRRSVAVLDDPEARQYVGALAYHVYRRTDAPALVRMRELSERYRLPVWMTEYSNGIYGSWPVALEWGVTMHELLTVGGVGAVDYLFAFFGFTPGTRPPDQPLAIAFDRGVYQSFSLRPTYWITGQFSRFVRPGYFRVAASPEARGDVLVSAYRGDGKLVVVALNAGSSRQRLVVGLRRGTVRAPIAATRTSAREQWRAVRPSHVAPNGFSAALPPQSITTFVARLR